MYTCHFPPAGSEVLCVTLGVDVPCFFCLQDKAKMNGKAENGVTENDAFEGIGDDDLWKIDGSVIRLLSGGQGEKDGRENCTV